MIEIDNTSAKRIARYLTDNDDFIDRLATAIAAKSKGITVTPLIEAAVQAKPKARTTRAQEC